MPRSVALLSAVCLRDLEPWRDGGHGDLFDLALPVPHVSMVLSAKTICLKGAVVAGRERGVREEAEPFESLLVLLISMVSGLWEPSRRGAVCRPFGLKAYLLALAV